MLGEQPIEVVHIESGVDYITMTMGVDEVYSASWWNEVMEFMEGEQANGNCIKQTALLGYSGALVGQMYAGSRSDGIICRASGAAAKRVYASLYNPFCRVSRLDIQTTVWTSERVQHIGPESYASADKFNRYPSGAIKRKVNYRAGNDGGWTTYVGSKGSNHFLRFYDKMAQSKDERYLNAWRYEVQVQNASAGKVAEALTHCKGSLESTIASTVWRYCTERGISPIYCENSEAIVVPSQEVPQTDVERMLTWLKRQVVPTVDRLKRMGYTADVAEMFSLTLDAAEDSGAHD